MNTKLFIGSEQADFNDVFNVMFSIGDIRDVSFGSNNKSYTLNLPPTKTNKRLTKFISQPDVKTELNSKGILFIESTQIFQGQINVLDSNDQAIKIIINSDDWMDNYANLKLSALDLSAHDHTFSHANIIASWSAVYPFYRYPMIDFGALATGEIGATAKWRTADFIPMFSIVNLLSAILAPRFVVSSWMALPFVKDLYMLARETIANESFINKKGLLALPSGPAANESVWDIAGLGRENSAKTYDPVTLDTETTDEGNDFATNVYTIPETGTYRFLFTCKGHLSSTPNGTNTIWQLVLKYRIYTKVAGIGAAIALASVDVTGTVFTDVAVQKVLDSGWVHLTANDTVYCYFQCDYDIENLAATAETYTLHLETDTHFENTWSRANLHKGLGYLIEPDKMLPDISQLDFLAAVRDVFNLRFWYDKLKNTVYIEPWDSFFTRRATLPESSLDFLTKVALPVMIRTVERVNEPWTGGTRWHITAHNGVAKTITFDIDLPCEIGDFGTDVSKRWQVQGETAGDNVQITAINWLTRTITYTTLRGTLAVGQHVTFWNPFRTFQMNPFTALIEANAWATTYVSPGGVWLHSDGQYRMIVNGWDSVHGMTGLYKSPDLLTWTDCTGAFYYHANTHPFDEAWCVGAATHWTYGSPVKVPGTAYYAKAFQGLNAAGRGEVGIVIFDEDYNIITMPTAGITVPGYVLDADHHYYPGGMIYFDGVLYLTIRYRNTVTSVDKILIMKLDGPTTYVCSDVEEVCTNSADTYYETTALNPCPFIFNGALYVWVAGENATADAPIGPNNMMYGLFYKTGGAWTPHAQNPIICNPMYGENVYSGCDWAIDHMGTSLSFFQTNNILHLFFSAGAGANTYKIGKMAMTLFTEKIVDLTEYVDFESIETELISKNYSNKIIFKFKDDTSDQAYVEYLKTASSPGQKEVTLSSVYTKKGEETREQYFSSIISAGASYTIEGGTLPRIWRNYPLAPPTVFDRMVNFNPRIVHWEGLTSTFTWYLYNESLQALETKTSYPKITGLDFNDATNPVYADYWLKFMHYIDKGKLFTVRMKVKAGFLTQFLTVIKTVYDEAFRPTYQIEISGVKHNFFLQRITSDGNMAELELILRQ